MHVFERSNDKLDRILMVFCQRVISMNVSMMTKVECCWRWCRKSNTQGQGNLIVCVNSISYMASWRCYCSTCDAMRNVVHLILWQPPGIDLIVHGRFSRAASPLFQLGELVEDVLGLIKAPLIDSLNGVIRHWWRRKCLLKLWKKRTGSIVTGVGERGDGAIGLSRGKHNPVFI